MNRIITVLSMAFATSSFAFMCGLEIKKSIIVGIVIAVVSCVGFYFESLLNVHGNYLINKIVYFFTKSDNGYSFISRDLIYEYLDLEHLQMSKKYNIKVKARSLDRIQERYSWTGTQENHNISSIENGQQIRDIHKQEIWNCYSIYLNKVYHKNDSVNTGSSINNLVDEEHKAIPFLSSSINTKTKELHMVVKIPKELNPKNAKITVYSQRSTDKKIASNNVNYDDVVGGFSFTESYPRKGWRYVLSWEF